MQQPVISSPEHPATPPPMTEAECSTHLQEKHLQMVMNARQAGREIPAVPVYADVVGNDLARTAVEASERTMKRANRKSFVIPAMPWHKQ